MLILFADYVYSQTVSNFIPACPLDIFDKTNPLIFDQNITDKFIVLTKSCIGQKRGNSSYPAECYTCEEFVCAVPCIVQAFSNVSI